MGQQRWRQVHTCLRSLLESPPDPSFYLPFASVDSQDPRLQSSRGPSQREHLGAWRAVWLICTITIDFPVHIWSPVWPVQHPGSPPMERAWISQSNRSLHFFLETGCVFSEHKLTAVSATRASAFHTTHPSSLSPLTYFIPAGEGLRFLPLPRLQELCVFSTVWFIYSSFQH